MFSLRPPSENIDNMFEKSLCGFKGRGRPKFSQSGNNNNNNNNSKQNKATKLEMLENVEAHTNGRFGAVLFYAWLFIQNNVRIFMKNNKLLWNLKNSLGNSELYGTMEICSLKPWRWM